MAIGDHAVSFRAIAVPEEVIAPPPPVGGAFGTVVVRDGPVGSVTVSSSRAGEVSVASFEPTLCAIDDTAAGSATLTDGPAGVVEAAA